MGRLRTTALLVAVVLMTPGAATGHVGTPRRPGPTKVAGIGGLFLDRDATFYTDDGVPVRRLGLKKNTYYGPVFSPDGTRVALVPTDDINQILVGDQSGTYSEISRTGPADDEGIDSLAWSPDGETIAFRRHESGSIWTVPVDSGAPTQVLSTGSANLQFVESGLSWNPVDGRIAFTARVDDGPSNAGSIYTVPATGGAPTRLVTAKCTDGTDDCDYTRYRDPTWSPDGTRLAAYVLSLGRPPGAPIDHVQDLVVTVSSSGTPTERAVLTDRDCVGSGGCSFPSSRDTHPVWSADGQALMIGPNHEEGSAPGVRYLRLGGTTTELDRADYDSWLPCGPTVCDHWGSAEPGLTLQVERRPTVVATGVASPLTGRVVLVRLERLIKNHGSKRWALVKSARVPLDDFGGYEAGLGRGPRAGKCRVKAAYEGESATEAFAC